MTKTNRKDLFNRATTTAAPIAAPAPPPRKETPPPEPAAGPSYDDLVKMVMDLQEKLKTAPKPSSTGPQTGINQHGVPCEFRSAKRGGTLIPLVRHNAAVLTRPGQGEDSKTKKPVEYCHALVIYTPQYLAGWKGASQNVMITGPSSSSTAEQQKESGLWHWLKIVAAGDFKLYVQEKEGEPADLYDGDDRPDWIVRCTELIERWCAQ